MKVALVHDYLTEYGGAERTLEALHELYPRAPIYTSLFDEEKCKSTSQISKPDGWDIRGFKGYKGFKGLTKAFTFFMPLVFENFDLRPYDVVISDGTIWSKGVLTTPEQLHIFYGHTPARFLYPYPGETDRRRLWYLKPLLAPLDLLLRTWDFASAQRPDYIVANSQTTAARIRKFWRRESVVIYPPVGIKGIKGVKDEGGEGGYFLVVSRLSAYKNVDVAIRACNELQLPLKIVGTGREEKKLRGLAGPTVKLLGFVEDSELSKLYTNCRALIHTVSDEDFGIAPVEAMSFGKPVMALRSGGVQETVIEGKTGVFFNEPTVESLVAGLKGLKGIKGIKKENCVERAARFSKERFQKEFKEFVESKWEEGFKGSKRFKG